MSRPLAEMLKTKAPLILDGAMGTELKRRGFDTALPLWSANVLTTNPDAVLQIHLDYLAAGADIITTDTFRTTRRTFHHSHLPDRSAAFTSTAIDLARRARDTIASRTTLIAGSIAPLEDCYRPDLVPPDAELTSEHAELAGRLAAGGVDFILLETMNTVREAFITCDAAKATGLEVIVSLICNEEGKILSGESLADAVRTIAPLHPDGFSLNCISPRKASRILAELRSLTDRPIAVYANIGRPGAQAGNESLRSDVDADEYATCAADWLRLGASIIGGCCGSTPEYISRLCKILPQKHEGTKES